MPLSNGPDGDVPINLKLALKVTHPSENADFGNFRLTVLEPWELVKKVQLSLIGSRHWTFPLAIGEPCALPLSPAILLFLQVKFNFCRKKFAENFYILRCFHILVAGNHRHLKFGVQIDHRKSQPKDNKLSLKWAWSCHVIHFKYQGHRYTSGITLARIVKFLTRVGYI